MTSPQKRVRPTDDLIVLAALAFGNRGLIDGEWLYADEIRGQLRKFGFDPHTQQVAAWLGRLVREGSPMFERRNNFGRDLEYRVTRFGRTQISNHFPGLRFWP